MLRRYLWVYLSLLWIALSAVYFFPIGYSYFQQISESTQERIAQIKAALQSQPSLGEIDLNSSEFTNRDPSLLFSHFLYPQKNLNPLFLQLVEPNCELIKNWNSKGLDAQARKTLLWLRYQCQHSALPEAFFSMQPFEHPQGGSWALFAHRNSKSFGDREWLEKHSAWLHLSEWIESFVQSESLLKKVDPDTLTYMLNRQPLILADPYVLAMDSGNPMRYKVWPLATWQKSMQSSLFKFGPFDPANCLVTEGFSCWSTNTAYTKRVKWNLLFFGLFTILLLAFIIFRLLSEKRELQAIAEANQQILVQTLAHELRHPATGIRLSMEVFRDQYDNLSDVLKEEFLRMTGQMQRLQRIIHASQQYLHSDNDSDQTPFKFKQVSLDSFNEYLLDLLENYQEKIEVVPLTKDAALIVDPYWLGMCITNLVKNALTHGQRPIRVRAERDGKTLIVSVSDSGQGLGPKANDYLNGKPQKSTAGSMGLGLSLVVRIIKLMGGSLHYQQEPRPTFAIHLEVLS